MRDFPQDLVIALIFGAVLLVQFLLKHLRKQGPQSDVEVDVEAGFEPDTVLQRPNAAEAPRPTHWAPTRPLSALPRTGPASARPDSHRFSRRSLMGSRRAVQDAIVIAAILGPCRAYRPHDID